MLVNLTNDGWFWGSSELEMHLACGVFRAIECRKPFLDRRQHRHLGLDRFARADVVAQGPKRATDVIIADTRLDDRAQPLSGRRRLAGRILSGFLRRPGLDRLAPCRQS